MPISLATSLGGGIIARQGCNGGQDVMAIFVGTDLNNIEGTLSGQALRFMSRRRQRGR